MTEMDRLSSGLDLQDLTGTETICMPLTKDVTENISRKVSLERNEFPDSECLEERSIHEKSLINGNFYEWNCVNHNPNCTSADPWIPRSKNSKSKYFCVKNESSLDSSPKNELNFCSKCNLVFERNFPVSDSKHPEKSKKTKFSLILHHFKKFCETTSLRGVPKIVHSQKKQLRILWLIFVLVFFIACMTCLILLIKQYRAYDVIHQPKTSYNNPSDFPSVTFCNLRPFSSRTIDFLKKSNVKSLLNFLHNLRKSFENISSIKLSAEDRRLFSSTYSLDLFLMNLPSTFNTESIGHSQNSMIINCNMHYASGSEMSSKPCEIAGKWILTKNELFLNCYTYTIDTEFLKIAKAVDLTLHVDDRLLFECPDCNQYVTPSQMTGIRFSLHTTNTYPDVIAEGQNLSPGTFTDAVFYTKQWNMMQPPYGKCSKELTSKFAFEEGDFLYSLSGCKKYIIQDLLYNDCNCIKYNSIPKKYAHLNKSSDVCNFIEYSIFKNSTKYDFDMDSIRLFLNRTQCKKITSHQFLDDYTTCTVPCQYYTFDVKVSSGLYPTKSFHLWFTKRIQNILKKKIEKSQKIEDKNELKAILDKLKIYDHIALLIKNGSLKEAEEKLKNTDIIERNFLTIQINRQDFTIIKVEEKEVISITSFLSQTGGMFSIWSGITFFCLVEFIELMMNIFDSLFSFQP